MLPIDQHAFSEAERRLARWHFRRSPAEAGMMGAVESCGCDELFTYDKELLGTGKWRFKITVLRHHNTK